MGWCWGGCGSAKLGQALRDGIGVGETRLRALARKSNDGCRKSYPERPRLEHADVGIVESSKGVSGEVVVAARLYRGHTFPEAGKRERMVADGADVVLGLPDTPPLDARTRVERVDDAPPEEVSRGPVVRAPSAHLPSCRTGGGTVGRRDESEPPASSRGRTEARPGGERPGRWSDRARDPQGARRRARRRACVSSQRARQRPTRRRRWRT